MGMATQNSYNTSASFEAGLSSVQTENGARIENGEVEPGDFLSSMTLFSNPTLGRELCIQTTSQASPTYGTT
jgi:hypothetical protein